MIVTVLSAKGGVGKSTTAIHLATYFQSLAPTLLVDGDGIRSATKWSQRGNGQGLPFKVIGYAELARSASQFTHIIIDTEALSDEDFRDATKGSDALVIPAVPESVATDGLTHTIAKLQEMGSDHYRVLLTMVPPKPRTEGAQLRQMLVEQEIPSSSRKSRVSPPLRRPQRRACRSTGSRTTRTPIAHGKRMRQLRRSCSMAERKFAALANLRQREPDLPPVEDMPSPTEAPPVAAAPEPAPAPPPAQVPVPVLQEPQKGGGRPLGKRSDPDWAPRTIRRALEDPQARVDHAARARRWARPVGTGRPAANRVDSETTVILCMQTFIRMNGCAGSS